MTHLVENVEEYSMNANRMCKGPVADGSLVRRRAANVAGLGEQSEGTWVGLDLDICQIKESVFSRGHWKAFESF